MTRWRWVGVVALFLLGALALGSPDSASARTRVKKYASTVTITATDVDADSVSGTVGSVNAACVGARSVSVTLNSSLDSVNTTTDVNGGWHANVVLHGGDVVHAAVTKKKLSKTKLCNPAVATPVTAVQTYALSITATHGSVTCDGGACAATYPSGTNLTLAAVPDSDYGFTGWSGDCSGSGTCPLTMDTAKSVTASFALLAHAPVLDTTKSPTLSGETEDAPAPVGTVGTQVSALVDLNPPAGGLDNVTDADAGAVTGMAIVDADTANGAWWYSTDNGSTWLGLSAVTSSSARLLAADANTRVYFQPAANFNGSSTVTFRAWDQTSGTAGSTADTTTNGGTTAFSSASDTASVTVSAVNDAPVLDATKSPALTTEQEDAPAPTGAVGTLVSDLIDLNPPVGGVDNASDVDASPVTGMAIIDDSGSGTWWYSINNGSTWSGVGLVADSFARLLAADANTRLYFQPTANSFGSATITFRAWDRTSGTAGGTADASTNGGTTSFSAASDMASLDISAVNDAPVLDASKSPTLTAETEDAPAPVGSVGTPVSSLIDFASPSGQNDNVTDVDGVGLLGMAITGSDESIGTWYYTTDSGPTWHALGAASSSTARLLATSSGNRLYFQPTANASGSATITFRAWDQTSGTNGSTADTTTNGGTTAFSSASDTASVTVSAVNDAPALDASASPVLTTETEDDPAPSGAVGTLVSSLVDLTGGGGLDNVSDADASPVTGMAITAADTTGGTWNYSIDNGSTWQTIGAVSTSAARLLAADGNTRLYFTPNANFNGSATITFRAWDQTSGSNGSTANTSTNGGSTAFSSTPDTASVTVTSVNDSPTLVDTVVLMSTEQEDAGAPVGAVGTLVSNLVGNGSGQNNVTDPDGPGLGIYVNNVSTANGSWLYSLDGGSTWLAMGTVTGSSSRLLPGTARLYFQPNANFNGSISSAITFGAWDQASGTAGSLVNPNPNPVGAPYSSFTDTASLTVSPVNDAPALDASKSPVLTSVAMNAPPPTGAVGTLVSSLVDLNPPSGGLDNVTDADTSPVTGMAITDASTTGAGTWWFTTNGGTTWTLVGSPTVSAALLLAADASTRVYFEPTAGFTGSRSITFRAWDRTSGTNGSTANTTANGGTTAFSVATDLAPENVT